MYHSGFHTARQHSISRLRTGERRARAPQAAWILACVAALLFAMGSLRAQSPSPLSGFRFIENRGQWNPRAKYMLDRGSMRVWMAAGEVVYELGDGSGRGHVLRQRFAGAAESAPAAEGTQPGRWSYDLGERSARDVPAFSEVRYNGLYEGIGARYYESGGALKYDLKVAPGADPSAIRFAYDGANSVAIDADGSLAIGTSVGEMREDAPYCYQLISGARREVACRFVRDGRGIGFALGKYNHNLPLVIDPTLIYSSYLGGVRSDAGRGIALDATGNIYVTGTTISEDFPPETGPVFRNQSTAMFVAKLDRTGSTLLAKYVMDGGGADEPSAIRVRKDGSAIVIAGTTFSPTFSPRIPITPGGRGPADSARKGDGFVIGLSTDLSAVRFFTYFGGSDSDRVEDMVLGNGDSILITGWTQSDDLPTLKATQTALSGGTDAFVAEFSPNCDALSGSTYLGGTRDDRATAIAPEPGGAMWIAGWTQSTDFRPSVLSNAIGPRGARDCFVTRVWFNGTGGDFTDVIGGSADDEARAIAVKNGIDVADTVYITGRTVSNDYPATIPGTPGAWFVTQIIGNNPAPGYSLRLGAANDAGGGSAIEAGSDRYVYMAGATSAAFPTTPDAVPSRRGGLDIAFVRLDPNGTVVHSSVIGGTADDIPWHESYLGPAPQFDFYITGVTRSADLPLGRGAYDISLNRTGRPSDSTDAFVMRFGFIDHPTIFSSVKRSFDTLRCGNSELDTFYVYNIGSANLVITPQNSIGSPFKVIEPNLVAPVTVKPGDSLRYILRFTSSAVGTFSGTLSIGSNDPQLGTQPFEIAVTAVRAVPSLNSLPDTLRFGTVLICDDSTLAVRVNNGGISSVTITSVTLAGPDTTMTLGPVVPSLLQKNESINIPVTFKPRAKKPAANTILIRVADCDTVFRIPITGTGDSAAALFAPAKLQFGALPLCVDSLVDSVRITNMGASTLHLVPGQSPVVNDEFTRSTPLPDSIRPGESVVIGITFRPHSGTGGANATFTVRFIECGLIATLPLSGERSDGATLEASLANVDFGLLEACAGNPFSSERTLVLRNHSAGDITIAFGQLAPPFFLADTPAVPTPLKAGDSITFTIRYVPAVSGSDAAVLDIPYSTGPCNGTLHIHISGSRDELRLDAPVTTVNFAPLLACDHGADTSLVFYNHSHDTVTIERIDTTRGASHIAPLGLPRSIAPGDSITVHVAFVADSTGDAVKHITYFLGPCGDSIVITLHGTKEGVSYKFRSDRLDFPPRLSCNAAPALDSFLLGNTGSDTPLTIRSVRIVGDPAFTVGVDLAGRVIPKQDSVSIPILFTPGAGTGALSGILEVVLDPCGDTLRGAITASILTPTLGITGATFGDVGVNTPVTRSVVIRNSNPDTIRIASLDGITAPFTFVGNNLPITLPPGDSVTIGVEFTPTDTLEYAPTLQATVSSPCEFTGTVLLSGRGVAAISTGDIFCLSSTAAGLVGDTVELVIGATTQPHPLVPPGTINYWLGYDRTQLQLVGVEPSARAHIVSEATGNADAQIAEQGASVVGPNQIRVRFHLLLGRNPVTMVRLDSVVLAGTNTRFGLCGNDGSVTINDHCVVTNIFLGKYPNRLEDIAPNPSGSSVAVTYQQLEDARAILRIYDIAGHEVLRPLDQYLPGGRYTVRFSVNDLSSGAYVYSIEAGGYYEAKKMMVRR